MRTDQDLKTIDAMKRYGGSFVKALAEAALHADPDNLKRIKTAFPEYWERFTEMANWVAPDAAN